MVAAMAEEHAQGGPMLVLSRKLNEKIIINGDIVVTLVKIDRNQVRIGIEAPADVPVFREEIAPRKPAARRDALATAGV
jgi:carbon storage regulator